MLSRTSHDRDARTMDGRDFHLPVEAARTCPSGLDTEAQQSQVLAVYDSLARRGPAILWLEFFVVKDKTYCVHLAADEELIREHARMSGLPADLIESVATIIDPSLAPG